MMQLPMQPKIPQRMFTALLKIMRGLSCVAQSNITRAMIKERTKNVESCLLTHQVSNSNAGAFLTLINQVEEHEVLSKILMSHPCEWWHASFD